MYDAFISNQKSRFSSMDTRKLFVPPPKRFKAPAFRNDSSFSHDRFAVTRGQYRQTVEKIPNARVRVPSSCRERIVYSQIRRDFSRKECTKTYEHHETVIVPLPTLIASSETGSSSSRAISNSRPLAKSKEGDQKLPIEMSLSVTEKSSQVNNYY